MKNGTQFRKNRVPGPYACYQRLQFAQCRITPVQRHDLSSFRTTIRTTLDAARTYGLPTGRGWAQFTWLCMHPTLTLAIHAGPRLIGAPE